jgi:hypothetical protein
MFMRICRRMVMRSIWRQKEKPTGPLLLQGDHGPVAFRNVRLRPLPAAK